MAINFVNPYRILSCHQMCRYPDATLKRAQSAVSVEFAVGSGAETLWLTLAEPPSRELFDSP